MTRERKDWNFQSKKVRCEVEPSELLSTSKKLLTSLQSQERFLLETAMLQCPCIHPDCDQKSNQLEACVEEVYDVGQGANTYRCPACATPMMVAVPFMAMGVRWFWTKARKAA